MNTSKGWLPLEEIKAIFLKEQYTWSRFWKGKIGFSPNFTAFTASAETKLKEDLENADTPDKLNEVFYKWREITLQDWCDSL
jgi:hypothetical protein